MARPFQLLEQFSDIVMGKSRSHSERARLHPKRLRDITLPGCIQPQANGVVYRLLKRPAGAAHFRFEQLRNVLVESKCCSHIMMLQ